VAPENFRIEINFPKCASCAAAIEKQISTLSGISKVAVRPPPIRAWIDYAPGALTVNSLIGTLKALGYNLMSARIQSACRLGSGGIMTRRSFLDRFLATSFGGFLIPIFYPVTRYLVPPKVEESTSRNVTLSIKPEEVKANSAQIFRFGSQPGILLRTSAGDLRAFSAVCTHLACIVQYRADLVHIWCACHNGHFDLNGKNIAGPPPRPLEQFSVNVRGDRLVVSKGV